MLKQQAHLHVAVSIAWMAEAVQCDGAYVCSGIFQDYPWPSCLSDMAAKNLLRTANMFYICLVKFKSGEQWESIEFLEIVLCHSCTGVEYALSCLVGGKPITTSGNLSSV